MAGWFKSRQTSDNAEQPQAVYQDQQAENDEHLAFMNGLIDLQVGKLPNTVIDAARKEALAIQEKKRSQL